MRHVVLPLLIPRLWIEYVYFFRFRRHNARSLHCLSNATWPQVLRALEGEWIGVLVCACVCARSKPAGAISTPSCKYRILLYSNCEAGRLYATTVHRVSARPKNTKRAWKETNVNIDFNCFFQFGYFIDVTLIFFTNSETREKRSVTVQIVHASLRFRFIR